MNLIQKQISKRKSIKNELRLQNFFIILIFLGIPLNLYKNNSYDNSWTIGEWLISYAGGFVRRGLPGELIHIISRNFQISPIYLIWFVCFISLIFLGILLKYFCKPFFNQSFLFSQLILLGPLSEDYFIRKDIFIVLLYGLSLLTFSLFYKKKLNKFICFLFVNLFSILAILSHESYGIWALPSIIIIFFIFEKNQQNNIVKTFIYTCLSILPSIIIFSLCWVFKGTPDQSLSIHLSWQNLQDILPSLEKLTAPWPDGAISALGTTSGKIYSNTLISQFNLLIFWHPGMWLLTIFLVIKLFIGHEKNIYQKSKRILICMQLIAFLPMFLFVDIGRWIFMWLTSSAFLFSFLIKVFGIESIINQSTKLKGSKILPRIIPAFTSEINYNWLLLFLGIPHCCWSMGRYLISNPIGFAVKNIIFYVKFII
tara:strand:- start:244 stop:1521 length:1278 start_codon:yes stop_codon:yes gene_type:complete